MEPVLVGQTRARQRRAHPRDIRVVEAHRLEIGEAPPDLAKGGIGIEPAPISGDRLVLAADGLERMAIAHPQLGLVGAAIEHLAIERDRLLIIPDPAEDRGTQRGVSGVAGVGGIEPVELLERLRRAVLAVQYGGEVGAGRGEGWGKLDRSAQQHFAVAIAADPRGQLGHHPDRRDVGRRRLEMGAEQRLGDMQLVGDERGGGAPQFGILGRGIDRSKLGIGGRLVMAERAMRAADQAEEVGIAG